MVTPGNCGPGGGSTYDQTCAVFNDLPACLQSAGHRWGSLQLNCKVDICLPLRLHAGGAYAVLVRRQLQSGASQFAASNGGATVSDGDDADLFTRSETGPAHIHPLHLKT